MIRLAGLGLGLGLGLDLGARRARPRKRRADAGVTLVEVLVVLALVGILAGAVGLGFGRAGRSDDLTREAALLAARLNLAVDEVILSGQPVALILDPEGYRFEMRRGGEWVAHSLSRLAEPHRLPPRVTLDHAAGGLAPVRLGSDLLILGGPVTLRFRGAGGARALLRFDGITAAGAFSDGTGSDGAGA